MSLIWSNRAALNTPFTPLMLNPIAFYEADFVRIFSGSKVDRIWNKAGAEEAKHGVQNTEANMPSLIASDPVFNNQSVLVFAYAEFFKTGVFATPPTQPLTYYAAMQTPEKTLAHYAVDGLATGNRVILGLINSTNGVSTYAGTQIVGPTDYGLTPIIICATFNGASSVVEVNSAAAYTTANPGPQTPLGLTIGNHNSGAGNNAGKLAALAIYQGAHDAATRARVRKYFGNKYGIAT